MNCWPNAALMLAQRLRCWLNMKTTFSRAWCLLVTWRSVREFTVWWWFTSSFSNYRPVVHSLSWFTDVLISSSSSTRNMFNLVKLLLMTMLIMTLISLSDGQGCGLLNPKCMYGNWGPWSKHCIHYVGQSLGKQATTRKLICGDESECKDLLEWRTCYVRVWWGDEHK